jgi:hypothetical protein
MASMVGKNNKKTIQKQTRQTYKTKETKETKETKDKDKENKEKKTMRRKQNDNKKTETTQRKKIKKKCGVEHVELNFFVELCIAPSFIEHFFIKIIN